MPAQTQCPISEIDRALSSYINTREDTLKIRRTLSRFLTSSIRPVNAATQNYHLNHECPQNLTAANTYPPGLKDLRMQYLQALRVKNQAQSRHQELQASLQALQERHFEEHPTQSESEHDNDTVRAYVALLRQRQRVTELQVIQDSLDKLVSAKPSHASTDPKTIVKENIGEQPDLPVERLEQIAQVDDDQIGIFKLKQEVLESKAAMERAQAARQKAQVEAPDQPSLRAQVCALEQARDELQEWVQGELAKLEEESLFLEDASPVKRTVKDSPAVDVASAETQVREAYDKYTLSRAKLLERYNSLQQPYQTTKEEEASGNNIRKNNNEANSSKPSMSIIKLLPHLPHLTQSANEERTLLRQTVYLENQIATKNRDMEEALLRLSGESHLLPAGSKDISAWSKTAKEAEIATQEFVKQHLQASQQELSNVDTILELSSLQSKVLDAV